jgi:hypothetical protein
MNKFAAVTILATAVLAEVNTLGRRRRSILASFVIFLHLRLLFKTYSMVTTIIANQRSIEWIYLSDCGDCGARRITGRLLLTSTTRSICRRIGPAIAAAAAAAAAATNSDLLFRHFAPTPT